MPPSFKESRLCHTAIMARFRCRKMYREPFCKPQGKQQKGPVSSNSLFLIKKFDETKIFLKMKNLHYCVIIIFKFYLLLVNFMSFSENEKNYKRFDFDRVYQLGRDTYEVYRTLRVILYGSRDHRNVSLHTSRSLILEVNLHSICQSLPVLYT